MRYYIRQVKLGLALMLIRLARRLMPSYRQRLFLFHGNGHLYEWRLYGNEGSVVMRAVSEALQQIRSQRPDYIEQL